MKEITPPKLMPPDQSRLARGMLPTEQTKDAMAMRTPTTQFSTRRRGAVGAPSGRKSAFHHAVRHGGHEKTGDEEADQDFLPHHRDVHEEGVRDGGPGFWDHAACRTSDFGGLCELPCSCPP